MGCRFVSFLWLGSVQWRPFLHHVTSVAHLNLRRFLSEPLLLLLRQVEGVGQVWSRYHHLNPNTRPIAPVFGTTRCQQSAVLLVRPLVTGRWNHPELVIP